MNYGTLVSLRSIGRKSPGLRVPVFLVLCITVVFALCTFSGEAFAGKLVFSCDPGNDVYKVVSAVLENIDRCDIPEEAIEAARPGDGILILAHGYPDEPVDIDPAYINEAKRKNLRLYIEYPASFPGIDVGAPRDTGHERGVVTSITFGGGLEPMDILYMHGCRFVPVGAENPLIAVAKVAGFDRAVYGIGDTETWPVLFEVGGGDILVATTALSRCITGRFAPAEDWMTVWTWIVRWLGRDDTLPALSWMPSVRPAFGVGDTLPRDAETRALRRGVDWFSNARLLVHPEWLDVYTDDARGWDDRVGPRPELRWPAGDGSLGVLEGFSSRVDREGFQQVRWWRRCDCNAEVAGALALAGSALVDSRYRATAGNICDWLIGESMLTNGSRADPAHPDYGLYGWNDVAKYWRDLDGYAVYYGDDNARALLGLMAAAAATGEDRWDESIIRCILANFRTAGPQGFRQSRINGPDLEKNGWRHYAALDEPVYAPHFQSYLWACYLWAYRHTGYAPFLERSETAIRMMMEAYPDSWHWTNGIQQERARMLLPLSWLVRVDDTPEHREWLAFMAREMLDDQAPCGGIREEIGDNPGRYGPPATNADYGTNEASLIHENGDPLVDLLYTTNFAFLGLHEAASATGDPLFRDAEDRLAAFLCRIQVASDDHPELDGAWFRAFDYCRWEHWASNADAGWGAWSTETGWTQGWITAVLALRAESVSLWDLTSESTVGRDFDRLRTLMMPE